MRLSDTDRSLSGSTNSMRRFGSIRRSKPFAHNIRVQLNEQIKCLDNRLEMQQGIASEYQDFFKRRAEIETNYAKELDKLAKNLAARNKEQRQNKRDGWHLFSSMQLMELLVTQTKRTAKDHSAISEIFSSHVVQRCSLINDDLMRIYKKCREIGYEVHEEVLKALHELHTAMKTHHSYQSEFRATESKLEYAKKQKDKHFKSVAPEKRAKNKRLKTFEKEYQKRNERYEDARLKATKARNVYLCNMDAANSSIQKYFVDDLSDLIDCMDFGFHQSLTRAVMMHVSAMDQQRRSLQTQSDQINKSLGALDSRLDKQRFIEYNNTTFMIPKKFEYNPVRRDESEMVDQKPILDELTARKASLYERLNALKTESEEIWKSMEVAEKSLSEMVGCQDYDTAKFFLEEYNTLQSANKGSVEVDNISLQQKNARRETEEFYMNKFREYVINSNMIARLQAKYDNIRATLGGDQKSNNADNQNDDLGGGLQGALTLTRRPNAARKRRIGNFSRLGGKTPKLFGGSLEEYLEIMNQDIPTVILSCVRVINSYGLHHNGIFRVNGSKVEINSFKEAFERGEDPLAEVSDANDINSVAGVLKLYFRELREPVFSVQYFDQFVDLAKLESKHEFVYKVRDVVTNWKRPVFIVMRYLFAFLNHLSEFSDENMMDPYNLAICFGPTLVPIPEDKDQVQYQNLVNELIKNFIIFHEDIFPVDIPGPRYEKYMTVDPDDIGDSPETFVPEDNDSEITEDDSVFHEDDNMKDLSLDLFGKNSETIEARAIYDFKARSNREVSFDKGESITLYKQVSNDWWRGNVRGVEGLIPDKYITIKFRGEEERDRLESVKSIDEDVSFERSHSLRMQRQHSSISRSPNSPKTSPRNVYSTPRSPKERSASVRSLSNQSRIPVLRGSTNSPTSNDSILPPDSGNPSPSSDTITPRIMSDSTITGEGDDSLLMSTTSGLTASTPANEIAPPFPPVTSSPSLSGTTHIIKVSGPVTNLDQASSKASASVGRGRKPSSSSSTESAEAELFKRPARSRQPLNLALGMNRLPSTEDKPENGGDHSKSVKKEDHSKTPEVFEESDDSTGSNKELKHQLDSTIAQVEAFAQEIEERKRSFTTQKSPENPTRNPKAEKTENSNGSPPINVKTWASRDDVKQPQPVLTSGFAKNKNMWERRSSASSKGGLGDKHTPDLVLGLPASSSKTLPKGSTVGNGKAKSPTTSETNKMPVPKPRSRVNLHEDSGPQVVKVKPQIQARQKSPTDDNKLGKTSL